MRCVCLLQVTGGGGGSYVAGNLQTYPSCWCICFKYFLYDFLKFVSLFSFRITAKVKKLT